MGKGEATYAVNFDGYVCGKRPTTCGGYQLNDTYIGSDYSFPWRFILIDYRSSNVLLNPNFATDALQKRICLPLIAKNDSNDIRTVKVEVLDCTFDVGSFTRTYGMFLVKEKTETKVYTYENKDMFDFSYDNDPEYLKMLSAENCDEIFYEKSC